MCHRDYHSKGVPCASTFHAAGLKAIRSTIQAVAPTDDGLVEIDDAAGFEDADVDMAINQGKIHVLLNSKFPPPKMRSLGPKEVSSCPHYPL